MRVALLVLPPTPLGRSFQAAYRTPSASRVVVGISKLRTSWPGAVSITSRRSDGVLQATIRSPLPLIGAIAVRDNTPALATSSVAIISLAAVMLKLVQPAGTD